MSLQWSSIPRAFPDQRVFIVGGGPSAKAVDWELLRGKNVLAINAAAFLLPIGIAAFAMFGDNPFLRAFRQPLHSYVMTGGVLLNVSGRTPKDKNNWMLHIQRLNTKKHWGISEDPSEVRWNRSTGGCALNVAYLLGASEIILIGYDMKAEGKQHNWHDEYSKLYQDGILPKPTTDHYRLYFLRAFDRIAEDLAGLGVRVWNATPNSALTVFPFADLEGLL